MFASLHKCRIRIDKVIIINSSNITRINKMIQIVTKNITINVIIIFKKPYKEYI